MRPRIQRQRRRPDRVPLAADVDLPQRTRAALIAVQPVDDPARTLLEHDRPPATEPSTAAPTPRPSSPGQIQRAASGTVTQSFDPVEAQRRPELDPPHSRPCPTTCPLFPAPDESAAAEPDPASKPYAATRPAERRVLRRTSPCRSSPSGRGERVRRRTAVRPRLEVPRCTGSVRLRRRVDARSCGRPRRSTSRRRRSCPATTTCGRWGCSRT